MVALRSLETYDTPADFWQEFPRFVPKEPLPPARLEDDFFMFYGRMGLDFWQVIHMLTEFHPFIPAHIYSQFKEFAPRPAPKQYIGAIKKPKKPLHLWRRLWHFFDQLFTVLALVEDVFNHSGSTPPGWHQ